jgi:hypothetical protein
MVIVYYYYNFDKYLIIDIKKDHHYCTVSFSPAGAQFVPHGSTSRRIHHLMELQH